MNIHQFSRFILFVCIGAVSSSTDAQLFRKNGLYYSGDKDTKEAKVISSDNKSNMVIPDTVEYDDVKYIVTAIGDDALQVNSMTSLTIGKHVRTLGIGCCNGCMNLISVVWGESIESIEWGAFQLCYALKSITWPEKVTSIGKNMFSFCPLEEFTIPATVTSIGSQAFSFTNLRDLYCSTTIPPSLESDTFFGVSISDITVHVPVGCKKIYESSEVWKQFPNIIDDQTSAIDIIKNESKEKKTKSTYLLNGKEVNNSTKGIILIRENNGSVKKILSK